MDEPTRPEDEQAPRFGDRRVKGGSSVLTDAQQDALNEFGLGPGDGLGKDGKRRAG